MSSKLNLLDLFNNITEEIKPLNLQLNSRVLFIDGMNTFIRSFAVLNHINQAGNHVGGLTGFLKSLGSAIKQLSPTRVIIVFDGEAGSQNRKYLLPEYKGNRNNQNVMNYKSFETKKDEDEAKINEISRLMDYLKLLPVNCMCIDKLEADDIIGYLCGKLYREEPECNITIMSSDRDFFQLINDRVSVWSPIKKIHYYTPQVLEEFGVHPANFLIYKAILGDSSDNVKGVHGIGEKKIAKMFPQLVEPERMMLDEVFEHAEFNVEYGKLFTRLLEDKRKLAINYQIMNLHEPNISKHDVDDIHRQFYREIPKLQKYDFVKMFEQDKMGDTIPYVQHWIELFSVLNNYKI